MTFFDDSTLNSKGISQEDLELYRGLEGLADNNYLVPLNADYVLRWIPLEITKERFYETVFNWIWTGWVTVEKMDNQLLMCLRATIERP